MRRENQWSGVCAAHGSDVADTDGSSLNVFAVDLAVLRSLYQPVELDLHLSDAKGLDILNVGDGEPVGGVNGDRDVVVVDQSVLEGSVGVVPGVELGVVRERQGEGLDEIAHVSYLLF